MSTRVDQVNLTLNVNSNESLNRLNELRKSAARISDEMKGLKKSTTEYTDKRAELSQVNKQMDTLKKTIGLTALSQKELTAELKKLNAIKANLAPFSDEFKKLQKEIKGVENRLYDVRNGVTGFASMFSKIKDSVKQFGLAAATYLGFQFITSQFKSILQGAGKLSDQLADLQRVSGLTSGEVNNLNRSFKELDTRTGTGALREIAIVAGKLGVAKEDILGFTTELDKLTVALGDELGDADQISTSLGKILNVFDGQINADNISKLGNSLVVLANEGVATGGFIVDFTTRLAGLSGVADITKESAVGLAAGLEELGLRSESSTTSVIKVLGDMAADTKKFAEVANISQDAFRKVLKENPIEALIQVAEGFAKKGNGFEAISKAFKEAGADGARVISTLGTLGKSADFVRGKIKLAGDAMQDTSAINEAFALKNETLGATLDKLGKEFNRLVTSSALTEFLKSAAQGALDFIAALKKIPDFISENSTALKFLVLGIVLLNRQYIINSGIIAYNTIAKGFNTAATSANALVTNVSRVAIIAYNIIVGVLTGRITLATAATRLWSLALTVGLGPIGLIITLVGALAVAFAAAFSESSKFRSSLEILNETTREAAKETAQQRSEIDTLTKVITDGNISLGNRQDALKRLIAISPEYLGRLTLENIATDEGRDILNRYNTALEKSAELKAASIIKDREFEKATTLKVLQQEIELAEKAGKGFADLSDEAQKYFSKTTTSVGRTAFTSSLLNTIPSKADFKTAFKDLQDEIDEQNANLNNASDNLLVRTKQQGDERKKALLTELNASRLEAKQVIENIDLLNKARNKSDKKGQEQLDKQISALETRYQLAKTNFSDLSKKYNTEFGTGKKEEDKNSDSNDKKVPGVPNKKEQDSILKEIEAFNKELAALKQKAELNQLTDGEREVKLVTDKYQDLLARARKYWEENSTIGREKTAEIIRLRDLELKDLRKKMFEQSSEEEYEATLKASEAFFDAQKLETDKQYAAGKLSKKDYEQALTDIEIRESQNRITIATDYADSSKKAAADKVKFQAEQEVKFTKQLIAEFEKRKAFEKAETEAGIQLRIINARKNSKAELEAQKDLLKNKFDQETEGLEDTSEQYLLKKTELQNAEQKLDEEYNKQKVLRAIAVAQQVLNGLSSINTIISNIEDRQLQKERARNKIKEKDYKRQLDSKLITQAKYDKKIAEMQEEQAKKETEIKRKQAKREKVLNLFQAAVNTASAVVEALPNIPLSIAVGLLGALQIAAIATAPLPEFGKGGYLGNGPKHSDKERGLHVVNPRTGKTEMLLEREEAVLNARAMKSNKRMSLSGTPRQIASALNSSHGGVSWANGASINYAPTWSRPTPQMNRNFVGMMAAGGIVGSNNFSSDNTGWQEVVSELRNLRSEVAAFDREKESYVVLSKIQAKNDLYNAAKDAGKIG